MGLVNSGTGHCKAKAGKKDRKKDRKSQKVKLHMGLELGGGIESEKGWI